MATEFCETNINTECIPKGLAKRNNYFAGKHISAEDLTLEQSYVINKIKRINSGVSGYGIINGLTIAQFNNARHTIEINEGMGLDSCGNMIVLYSKKSFTLPKELQDGDYIYFKYFEKGINRTTVGNDEDCMQECCFNHISEEMEIHVDSALLTLDTNNICTQEGNKRLHLAKASLPFLYLGQYKKQGSRGIIDKAKRVTLHTNAELSALLCQIKEKYVSSVNGQSGEISAVTSINTAKPDANGAVKIIAGNNISVTSEDNTLTIATTHGFHREYMFHFEKGTVQEINHNRGTFPTVDVYRRIAKVIRGKGRSRAVLKSGLMVEAKALNMSLDTYLSSMEAKSIEETIGKEILKTQSKERKVSSILSDAKVDVPSFDVLKIVDKPIKYYPDYIYVLPEYSYTKILGEGSNINVQVTHKGRNTLTIKNLGSKAIDLLVILNT